MRLHITLEDSLVSELDRRVGPRGRSGFLAQALREALEEPRRWELIEKSRGRIGDAGLKLDESPAAWVHRTRRADREAPRLSSRVRCPRCLTRRTWSTTCAGARAPLRDRRACTARVSGSRSARSASRSSGAACTPTSRRRQSRSSPVCGPPPLARPRGGRRDAGDANRPRAATPSPRRTAGSPLPHACSGRLSRQEARVTSRWRDRRAWRSPACTGPPGSRPPEAAVAAAIIEAYGRASASNSTGRRAARAQVQPGAPRAGSGAPGWRRRAHL